MREHDLTEFQMLTWLEGAHHFAQIHSGCTKVAVGSVILSKDGNYLSAGANRADGNLCQTKGCLREQRYGNNSKEHRNPDDCRAVHSEIDAIGKAHCDLRGATILISRYPCENCARAIVAAGISHVVYGRQQVISGMTFYILKKADVKITHRADFNKEDVVT